VTLSQHTQQPDRKVPVRSTILRKKPPTMSLSATSDGPPPQHLSIVGAFKTAPTLVKVLAAGFYLPALILLLESVRSAIVFQIDNVAAEPDGGFLAIFIFVYVLVGLVLAMVGFLLGKGIARGAHGTW